MLILASQSPRRRELLTQAGLPFQVRLPEQPVAEVRLAEEPPQQYVQRLAAAKADAVERREGEIVLGADTVVVVDENVLEKPGSPAEAAAMLRLLSGREHSVMTGIALRAATASVTDLAITQVEFAPLTEGEITTYISSGEPFDKAGGYAIQGLASKFIYCIQGDYSNVVGLPVARVYQHWRRLREL